MLLGDAAKVASDRHPDVAAMGSQTSARIPAPIGPVALQAAIELNDILNALGLRVALLRHRQNPAPPSTGNMDRLADLVEKAVDCVRNLQDYIRAEQLVGAIRTALIEREIAEANATTQIREDRPRTRVLLIGKERTEVTEDSSIRSGLERSGCDVIVAASVAEGLHALETEPDFDNIICDSEILGANGLNFASEVSRAAPAAKVYLLQNDSQAQARISASSRR
jgi:CheY-like chemotaxis protein